MFFPPSLREGARLDPCPQAWEDGLDEGVATGPCQLLGCDRLALAECGGADQLRQTAVKYEKLVFGGSVGTSWGFGGPKMRWSAGGQGLCGKPHIDMLKAVAMSP